MSLREQFIQAAEEKTGIAGNPIASLTSAYDRSRENALKAFHNPDQLKKRAHLIKWKTLENLDRFLLEFESNFTKRGGKLVWANNAEEARQELLRILSRHQVRTIVKSKTITFEELELDEFLKNNHILCQETDLGEYILSLRNERPRHPVTPASHISLDEVQALFNRKLTTNQKADPEELTAAVRNALREQYTQADAGITGANFLIADQGSVVITENEGNARMCSTFPSVHIVIAGIEKIIPSMADLDIFLPLLSSHGTGQNMAVYNSIIAPKHASESDGPKEMYVILIDNGRTSLLAQPDRRQSLYCIRCGACLNVCPVHAIIGGHAYQTVYNGPIGAVIEPHLKDKETHSYLSEASTLCGKCTEVCPVKIDLHQLLILNRRDAVNKNLVSKNEMWGWYLWTRIMRNTRLLNLTGLKIKKKLVKKFFAISWGAQRTLPEPAKTPFRKSPDLSQ